MGVLDDFFGDGRDAEKECLHCGGTDEPLEVAVQDHHGPTHWRHPACHEEAQAEHDAELEEAQEALRRHEYFDKTDGLPE